MDVSLYLEMLKYRRPSRSKTERKFIQKFLLPLGLETDPHGNYYKKVGDSKVIWSSHTDTVHRKEGFQQVSYNDNFAYLSTKDSASNCLGADCTTGVWLMHQMILANVPGLYIFHRDEEVGGLGSDYIAANVSSLLKEYTSAIAFDRFGRTSVITHQGGRCCSDDFANSIIDQMPGMKIDPNGLFTDTANYTSLVPECTNLSVGYFNHHTSNEAQDLEHMVALLGSMIDLDQSKLVIARDPNVVEVYGSDNDYYSHDYFMGKYTRNYRSYASAYSRKSEGLEDLVRSYPFAAADLMEQYGINASDLRDHINEIYSGAA